MRWRDDNGPRRKVRTLLTVLGSAVGVAAIVALTTFADDLAGAQLPEDLQSLAPALRRAFERV